ncbi:MAG TPA: GIY-YIG nuclease family protein [Caulobacteraceae bacterium]|jgi:predicted GIY-YIG superfamily endonuclease
MFGSWSWQGRSGEWYPHSVCAVAVPDWHVSANYILVRRNPDGTCSALYIGETADLRRRWDEHVESGLVRHARYLGLNELHVYLLAEGSKARLDRETDLRHGHPTPLNKQAVPAKAYDPFLSSSWSSAENALAKYIPHALAGDYLPPSGGLANALMPGARPLTFEELFGLPSSNGLAGLLGR